MAPATQTKRARGGSSSREHPVYPEGDGAIPSHSFLLMLFKECMMLQELLNLTGVLFVVGSLIHASLRINEWFCAEVFEE
jgi:hypothetical protein